MKNAVKFSLALAVCATMMACKTNKQYNTAVSDATNSGHTSGYNSGYSAGQTSGYSDGQTSGYSSGFSAGQTSGYNSGYSDGHDSGFSDGQTSGYNSGYSDGQTSGYNSGFSDGQTNGYGSGYAASQSNASKAANIAAGLQFQVDTSFHVLSVALVKFAQDDSNYAVYSVTNIYSGYSEYYALYVPSFTSGMTYDSYLMNANTTEYGYLTNNGDGTFSCQSCNFYPGGGNGAQIVSSNMVFETTSGTSKDLEKVAAIMEALQIDKMSSYVASQFGLSKDRSVVVAKMATAWNKLAKTRAVTDADADAFTKQLTGVSMTDMNKAEDAMRVGNLSPLNDVLSKAAAVNGTTSENMANIMNQLFIFN